jgi:hypothetical protein
VDAEMIEQFARDFGLWFYAIPILVFIIVNADKLNELIKLIERRDDNRLKAINDYLNHDETDSLLRDAFLEIRDAIYFKKIFGVYGSQTFRDAFLDLHKRSQNHIGIKSLSRAADYMTEEKGKIKISIPRGAIFEYWYNYLSAIFFTGTSVYLSVLTATGIDPVSIIFPIVGLFFGLYAIRELIPVRVAKKLNALTA